MPTRCNEIEAASFYRPGASSSANRRYSRSTEEIKINLVIPEGRPFSPLFTCKKLQQEKLIRKQVY
jgi:hypothetical protein